VQSALLLVVMGVEMNSDKAKNMNTDRMDLDLDLSRRAVGALVSMCIGGLVLSVGTSFADGSRATQTIVGSDIIVPYDGTLAIDDAPATGTKEIRFELFETSTGGAAEWTETQTVTFYDGRFSVGLGSSTSLTDTILDAEKLWLAMTIIDTNGSGAPVEIAMAGRQAIEPAPFAAWAINSADLQVAGDLDVDVNMEVAGSLNARSGAVLLGGDNDGSTAALQVGRADGLGGRILFDDNEIDNTAGTMAINVNSGNGVIVGSGGLTVTGSSVIEGTGRIDGDFSTRGDVALGDGTNDDTTVSGALVTTEDMIAGGAYLPKYRNWNGTFGDGGAGIFNDDNAFKALMIVGNDSSTTGAGTSVDRRVYLYDDVTISGDLTVGGTFSDFALSGEYTISQTGDGSNSVAMVSATNSFCFLTSDYQKGQDNDSSANQCYIDQIVGFWVLVADVDVSSDDVAACGARCFSW